MQLLLQTRTAISIRKPPLAPFSMTVSPEYPPTLGLPSQTLPPELERETKVQIPGLSPARSPQSPEWAQQPRPELPEPQVLRPSVSTPSTVPSLPSQPLSSPPFSHHTHCFCSKRSSTAPCGRRPPLSLDVPALDGGGVRLQGAGPGNRGLMEALQPTGKAVGGALVLYLTRGWRLLNPILTHQSSPRCPS